MPFLSTPNAPYAMMLGNDESPTYAPVQQDDMLWPAAQFRSLMPQPAKPPIPINVQYAPRIPAGQPKTSIYSAVQNAYGGGQQGYQQYLDAFNRMINPSPSTSGKPPRGGFLGG